MTFYLTTECWGSPRGGGRFGRLRCFHSCTRFRHPPSRTLPVEPATDRPRVILQTSMPEARRYGLDPGANGNAMPTVRSTYSTMAAMKARSAARRTPLLLQFAPIEMAPSTLDFARPTFQEIHRMARTNRQTSARQARKPRKREGAPSMFIRVENNHYFGLAEDIEAPSGLVVVHANAAALRLLATALHRIAREVERDSEIKRSTEPRSYPPFGFRLRPGDPPVRCAMSDIIAIEFRPYSNSDPPR